MLRAEEAGEDCEGRDRPGGTFSPQGLAVTFAEGCGSLAIDPPSGCALLIPQGSCMMVPGPARGRAPG
jgi:hypothetical protein